MATFEYEAVDALGKVRRGVINAESARLARRELRLNRLVPVRVDTTAPAAAGRGDWLARWRERSIAAADVALATRQLATLAAAAAPIEEALNVVALQTDRPALRNVLFAVRAAVTEGRRLSDALSSHQRVFPPLYRAMVAAGEMTGALGAVLERLADHLEKTERMKSRLIAALVYPAALSAVAIGVVTLLLAFVVPRVVEQFDTLGQDLPLLTRGLIVLADGLRVYGPIVATSMAVGGLVLARQARHENVRRALDRFILRVPVIGRVLKRLYAARLARTIGTLVGSGVPALDAVAAARAAVPNLEFADAAQGVAASIREGAGVSAALRKSRLFPPLVVHMAAVGESTGRLDTMLERAADQL
ncbi:MAG: type II secretion system F family protein, partial [Rhodospirillaceae bacterium]|nr:type II secretion system F family protein [Rhodospirillaceae bacterium]